MKNETFDLTKLIITIKINEKDYMLAQASLTYGDLKIHGFRVMKSDYEDGLFVQPPKIPTQKGKWLPLIFVDNQHKWHELQNMIKKEYKKAKKEYDKRKNQEEFVEGLEIIDPKDIPL